TVFMVLALRIRGRIVLSWLSILTVYYLRPHIFVFNKNTTFSRDIVLPYTRRSTTVKVKGAVKAQEIRSDNVFDYVSLLRNSSIDIRFTKKGLLLVNNYD